jgi:aminotransferase
VISREALADLAGAVANRDLFILSDEIYSRLIYEGVHSSIAMKALEDK